MRTESERERENVHNWEGEKRSEGVCQCVCGGESLWVKVCLCVLYLSDRVEMGEW